MASPTGSSAAVRSQLARALSLLSSEAAAARIPLPVPFYGTRFVDDDVVDDSSFSSTSTSTSTSTSLSSSSSSFSASPPPSAWDHGELLRSAMGDDSDLDASFARLRRLREQLDFLASTPPDVRESLSAWRQLWDDFVAVQRGDEPSFSDSSFSSSSPSSPSVLPSRLRLFPEAAAFELGALLLPSAARVPEKPEWASSDDEEDDAGDAIVDDDARSVGASLDAAALAAHRCLSEAASGGDGIDDDDDARSVSRLAALLYDGKRVGKEGSELSVVPRLRPAAVEWLYDGLDPLLLGRVLRRGRRLAAVGGGGGSGSGGGTSSSGSSSSSLGVGAGAPIALAAAASAIAARLGIANVPLPAEGAKAASRGTSGKENTASSVSSSSSPFLSPAVAARLAARTPAAAPDTGTWLLACPRGRWVWDPSRGEVVSVAVDGGEASFEERWPLAGFVRTETETKTKNSSSPPSSSSSPRSLLPPPWALDPRLGWSALLRACVVAHTRRGDSDAVAAVLPQLLALDGGAAEWAWALRAPEVLKK